MNPSEANLKNVSGCPCTSTSSNIDTNDDQAIKDMVKENYAKIANQTKEVNTATLCGISGGCCNIDLTIFAEDYSKFDGYVENADLGLGCGVPTSSINIKEGDVVLDLGCGAGNDCFIARNKVGTSGKVIGLDMTPEMLKKAWINTDKAGYNNVEFRFGEIENMPISNNIIDVIISNCVINLVPNKKKAFEEIQRVLKPQGIFSISDMVTTKDLPDYIRKAAEMYAGCVAGAVTKDDYLKIIETCGFNFSVVKEKEIVIPEEIMLGLLKKEEYDEFVKSGSKILSITVVGQKKKTEESCCSGKETCKKVEETESSGCCEIKK